MDPRINHADSAMPFSWLSFGFIGVVFARFLTRRDRTKFALSSIHILLFVLFSTIFVLTRILKFGNLSTHLLPDHPRHPNNPYLESWQAFLYTIKFPPDLAYSSLCLGVNSLLFAVIMLCKTEWKEKSPLLQFGRAPVFFYVANVSLRACTALVSVETFLTTVVSPASRLPLRRIIRAGFLRSSYETESWACFDMLFWYPYYRVVPLPWIHSIQRRPKFTRLSRFPFRVHPTAEH